MDKFNMCDDAGADVVKTTIFYRRWLGVYDVAALATNDLA